MVKANVKDFIPSVAEEEANRNKYRKLDAIADVARSSEGKKFAQIAKERHEETGALGFDISMAQRLLREYDPYPRNAPFWECPARITEWPVKLRQNAELVLHKVGLVRQVLETSARLKVVAAETKHGLLMGADLPLPVYLLDRLKAVNLTLVRSLIATPPKALSASGIDMDDFQLLKRYLGWYGLEFEFFLQKHLWLDAIADLAKYGAEKTLGQIARERLQDINELRDMFLNGITLLQEHDPYPRNSSIWICDAGLHGHSGLSQESGLILQKVDLVYRVLTASTQWLKASPKSKLELRMGRDLPLPDHLLNLMRTAGLTRVRDLITATSRFLKRSGLDLDDVRLLNRYLGWYGLPSQRPLPDGEVSDEMLVWSVSDLDFTVRTKMCLTDEGIYTIDDLVSRCESDLLKTPNMGRKSLKEIVDALALRGWRLGTGQHAPWADGTNPHEILTCPISELDLTSRTKSILTNAGINTVDDLVSLSERDLLNTAHLEQEEIGRIKELLTSLGWELARNR